MLEAISSVPEQLEYVIYRSGRRTEDGDLITCVIQITQKFSDMCEAFTSRRGSRVEEVVIRSEVRKAVEESMNEIKALPSSSWP